MNGHAVYGCVRNASEIQEHVGNGWWVGEEEFFFGQCTSERAFNFTSGDDSINAILVGFKPSTREVILGKYVPARRGADAFDCITGTFPIFSLFLP